MEDKTNEELRLELQELQHKYISLKAQLDNQCSNAGSGLKRIKRPAYLNFTGSIAKLGGWGFDTVTLKQTWTEEVYKIHELDFSFRPNVQNGISFYAPDSRPLIENAVNRAIVFGEEFDLELEFITSKGNRRWVHVIGKTLQTMGKVKNVYGSFQDITRQKQAELESRKIHELNTLFMKYSPIYAYIKEVSPTESRVLMASENYIDLIGIPGSEMVGKSMDELFNAEFAAKFTADDQAILCSGQVVRYEERMNDRTFTTIKFPIVLNDKTMLAGYSIDITERKLAEEELSLKNEELLKLNAEKDKFFSIIAHDLLSPFSGFLGLTELMSEGIDRIEIHEIQKMVSLLKSSATNLFRLLGNLLEWSRMQRGLTTFMPDSFLLQPLIQEAVVLSTESAKKKNITVSVEVPDDLKVFADENMFNCIVRNLVNNAVKFTPRGGKVSVHASPAGNNKVEILVSDTGIGMSKEFVEGLFHLDSNSNRKGTEGEPSTGLGLMICKDLIEKQGGTLRIDSEEGTGTRIYFTIREKHFKDEIKRLVNNL